MDEVGEYSQFREVAKGSYGVLFGKMRGLSKDICHDQKTSEV